jgi:DNA modification methylase
MQGKSDMEAKIIHGDNRKTLAELPERSFHCCVSSPPYWSLRDYDVEGQIGLEETPDEFVDTLVDVYRGVWRVLRDDGVCWVNLGDSYCSTDKWGGGGGNTGKHTIEWTHGDANCDHDPVDDPNSPFNCQCVTCSKCDGSGRVASWAVRAKRKPIAGIKPKDLMGMPWRVALALQADGWYLRDAVIWHKPAPMPGSQQDRCTSSYEFIFQLTKSRRYFFDMDAIKEPLKPSSESRGEVAFGGNKGGGDAGSASRLYSGNSWKGSSFTEGKTGAVHDNQGQGERNPTGGSTPRNVWTMASGGFKEAHFATFPIELPLRCIKASTSSKGCCSGCGAPWQRITERTALKRERPNELTKRTGEDGTGNHCANTVAGVEARTIGWEPTCDCQLDVSPCRVLDPFNGAGTTAVACRRLGIDYVGCELNQEYIDMSYRRLAKESNRDSKLKPVKAAAGQAELF